MKKSISVSILLIIFINVSKSQLFNIVDFGAVPNDSIINTLQIQNAIDSCFRHGGGTVYIPSGVFITGTIELKSKVNLHLESGAELKGSSNISDYKEYKTENYDKTHYGIIYSYKAVDVTISGEGTINGNEEVFFDWEKPKNIEWGGIQNTRQKENYRAIKTGIGDGPVMPKERPRQMIIFSECANVKVSNVKLIKSPFWTLHFADCDGILVTGIKIWASMYTPNSDGLDITSCNNVIISDCDIRTGDDAIAITGYAYHFELPGYNNLRHISENIVITNCNLQSSSSAIRIGFLDQNTIRNIHISNINITNSNRGIGIFLRDEGSIENITISQVNIETRLHTGDWWGNGEPIHISAVRGNPEAQLGQIKNVTFRDINCMGESGILVYGSDESKIEDVKFEHIFFKLNNSKRNNVAGGNIDLRGALGDMQLFSSDISAFYAQYVKNLTLNNITINWDNQKEEYFKYGIHVNNFDRLCLTNIDVKPSPSNNYLPSVYIENGEKIKTDINNSDIKKVNIFK